MDKLRMVTKLWKAQGALNFLRSLKFRAVAKGISCPSAPVRFDLKKDPTQRQFDAFLAPYFPAGHFDAVYAISVFEHITEMKKKEEGPC